MWFSRRSNHRSHTSPRLVLRARAPALGQGTGGFGINPQGTVVGSFLDNNNVFHGFQCVSGCGSPSTFSEFNAPGAGTAANQGTITFSINLFGVTTGSTLTQITWLTAS